MARAVSVAALLAVASTEKVALSTYAQGASFSKCINITDFESKTLADEIDLIDRDEGGGCCPEGSVPGAQWKTSYKGAQVVCGFKDDGTTALSTGSSNGVKTCTYNNCYVDKQNLPCADDSKQLLNGCCAGTTGSNTGFAEGCKNYQYSPKNAYQETYKYCATYDKDYGTKGWAGTSETTDDQEDGKLVLSKIYTYTPCEGGDDDDGDGDGGGDGVGKADGASIAAISGWLLSAAAAFASRQ